MADIDLTPDHHQLWRRMRRMVLRSDSALVIFLWGDDPRSLLWLRQQLDLALRARSKRVVVFPVLNEEGAVAALHGVLAPQVGGRSFAVWLEASRDPGTWPRMRHCLARINERRAQLLEWPRAVVICGPVAMAPMVDGWAPDLWSVRSASWTVPKIIERSSKKSLAGLPAQIVYSSAGKGIDPYPDLWRTAWSGAGADVSLDTIDIGLGFKAADTLLRERQLSAATDVLEQTRALLRRQAAKNLSIRMQELEFTQESLDGLLALALGQVVEAQEKFLRSLDMVESRILQFGESGHALFDLIGALYRHADSYIAAGALVNAKDSLLRSLQVCKRAVEIANNFPEVLRQRSIALARLGDVARALGDLSEARDNYEQVLVANDELMLLTHQSRQTVRDRSVALNKLGDILLAMRDAASAEATYRQSLELNAQLSALGKDDFEAQRDLAIAHIKVGDAARARGDLDDAGKHFEIALSTNERLFAESGESPESIRDLSVSQNKVAEIWLLGGKTEAAREKFKASLTLREQRLELTDGSTEALRDVAISHAHLGEVDRDQGKLTDARARYERAYAIAESALRQSPLSQDIQAVVDTAKAKLAALPPPVTPA